MRIIFILPALTLLLSSSWLALAGDHDHEEFWVLRFAGSHCTQYTTTSRNAKSPSTWQECADLCAADSNCAKFAYRSTFITWCRTCTADFGQTINSDWDTFGKASWSDFRKDGSVLLHGLQSRPEWNGKQGTLVSFHREQLQWTVDIEDGVGTATLNSSNLALLPKGGAKIKALQIDFREGDSVILYGLQSRPEWNGKRGTLASFDDEKLRWNVDFENAAGKALKPSNLALLPNQVTTKEATPTRVQIPATPTDKPKAKGRTGTKKASSGGKANKRSTPVMPETRLGEGTVTASRDHESEAPCVNNVSFPCDGINGFLKMKGVTICSKLVDVGVPQNLQDQAIENCPVTCGVCKAGETIRAPPVALASPDKDVGKVAAEKEIPIKIHIVNEGMNAVHVFWRVPYGEKEGDEHYYKDLQAGQTGSFNTLADQIWVIREGPEQKSKLVTKLTTADSPTEQTFKVGGSVDDVDIIDDQYVPLEEQSPTRNSRKKNQKSAAPTTTNSASCSFEHVDSRSASGTIFQSASPLVLTNLKRSIQWEAFDKWSKPRDFEALYGNESIQLRPWAVEANDLKVRNVNISHLFHNRKAYRGWTSIQFQTFDLWKAISKDIMPFPTLFKPIRTSPGFSLGFKGPGSGSHAHARTLFVQLVGRKWWAIAPPGAADMTDPCRWRSNEHAANRYKGCVLNAGEAIFWPDSWQHATCNLDPLAVGIPLRGDSSAWPSIAHHAADGNAENCKELHASPDDLLLAATVAAQWSHSSVLEVLFKRGVSVDARPHHYIDSQSNSFVQYVASLGHVAMTNFFLENGAIDQPGPTGGGLVHYAALKGHVGVLDALERRGLDVHLKDRGGLTPLVLAAGRNSDTVIKWLLLRKPSYQVVLSAMQSAKQKNHIEAQDALVGWLNANAPPPSHNEL